MAKLTDIDVRPLRPERFESVLDQELFDRFAAAIERAREMLADRVVWNVNSTGRGGGVAEMLQSLLAYAIGAGIEARWTVIEGNPDFFKTTKRIHNRLHGASGDGGNLGPAEAEAYEKTLEANADELTSRISQRDIVILHDPQTAGLTAALKTTGATVIWRCHVGVDVPNDLARKAWAFLTPYVEPADAYVFSRRGFAWEGLDEDKIEIIPPSIDAFSPKNQAMDVDTIVAILARTGLSDGASDAPPTYERVDGTTGTVTSATQVVEEETTPASCPLAVQVSRWDRLKDPLGVIRGFADHVARDRGAHLVVAGPDVAAVADDPEGAEVLDECRELWSGLPTDDRARIHLACLPMDDLEENAAIVNALQRRADVVVQKSIAEGFGLTVAEAMWKARPVVASRIGGIQDQVIDQVTGLLVDPEDLSAYGRAVDELLDDPDRARRMGLEAQERVRDEFLGPRHLMQYVDLIGRLIG